MKNFRENLMHMVFFLCALTSIFAVVLICIFLFANGVPAMKEIGLLDFLTGCWPVFRLSYTASSAWSLSYR